MTRDDSSVPNPEALLEEAETLTWALLDDQLDDEAGARLTQLLEKHDAVRARYVECVQLHVDLQNHYAGEQTAASGDKPKGVTVLKNLMPGGLSGIESRPPVTE